MTNYDMAQEWIDALLSGNGFGDGYTSQELNQWAGELVRLFDLDN